MGLEPLLKYTVVPENTLWAGVQPVQKNKQTPRNIKPISNGQLNMLSFQKNIILESQ